MVLLDLTSRTMTWMIANVQRFPDQLFRLNTQLVTMETNAVTNFTLASLHKCHNIIVASIVGLHTLLSITILYRHVPAVYSINTAGPKHTEL